MLHISGIYYLPLIPMALTTENEGSPAVDRQKHLSSAAKSFQLGKKPSFPIKGLSCSLEELELRRSVWESRIA